MTDPYGPVADIGLTAVQDRVRVAAEAVQAASPIALQHFRARIDIHNKAAGGSFDPVTIADRDVDSTIRQAITTHYPDDGFTGEEHGTTDGTSGYAWIVDPIDGTRAFVSGSPLWGMLVGLTHQDTPAVGLMHQPFTRETIIGSAEGTIYTDAAGKTTAATTSTNATLKDALGYSTDPDLFVGEHRAVLDALRQNSRMIRYGGDCYAFLLLALGQIDFVIEAALQPYDILPLIPIIHGAGGSVTRLHLDPDSGETIVLAAANDSIRQQALDHINT